MFYPLSAFIGLRYAKASKGNPFIAFINFFSVVGIALGLTALITVVSVMNGFEGQLKNRILGLMPHIVVDTRDTDNQSVTSLGQLQGVRDISQFVEAESVIQAARGLKGTIIQGIEPEFMQQQSLLSEHMLAGRLTNLQAGQYGIVIGRSLSIQLGLNLGEQVRILVSGASIYTPFGRMPSQRLFTVVGIFDLSSEMDDKVILMHLDDSARLLRKRTGDIAQTRLFLSDAFKYQQVEEQISLPTRNWRARLGQLFDAVKMEKNMMALMLVLIVAVAAFNIVSALVMVVTEKQGDIAILRTQGMAGRKIMQIFLFSGLYNGLKGTAFGLIGGLLLVSQINNLLDLLGSPIALSADGRGLPVDVQWLQVGGIVIASLLLCFLATLYPAYRAVRVQPADALKYE